MPEIAGLSRLTGWFWDHSPVLLRPLRRLKRSLSILLYRWRHLLRPMPPRVVTEKPLAACDREILRDGQRIGEPAVIVWLPENADINHVHDFLKAQTEAAVVLGDNNISSEAAFFVVLPADLDDLPATWIESQLFAAVAENLDWTVAGWAAPTSAVSASEHEIRGTALVPTLVRLPRAGVHHCRPILARAVPHIIAPDQLRHLPTIPLTSTAQWVSPYFLDQNIQSGRVLRHRTTSLYQALAELSAVSGPRTALFLLPFLAVGGAERLLFDLLRGLEGRYRCLVVTLDPHRSELGQTVDTCRALTPWVYTLGEWMPREAQGDALRHLIRRYQVETVVSWNGTVLFYEEASAWRRDFPGLRLVNQLFNHEGGWIEHYGPRLVKNVDLHIAINGPIGRALSNSRGVPTERLAVIHHGVEVPPERTPEARSESQRKARRKLGLPEDAWIIGSFLRLHAQKRPFDILRLARRLEPSRPGGRPIHFLLAGDGPLGGEIDRELDANPLSNLTRLPLQKDVEPLFDAIDLCLMTSAYEGLPIFLLEGLARSRPCVATAVGDISYLLEQGGGRVVEQVGNLDAFEAAILELCDSPDKLNAEGRLGYARVAARFGLEGYVQDYEKAIFPAEEARR